MILQNKNIIGIDPGLTGALALLNYKRELLAIENMPVFTVGKKREVDPNGLAEIITEFKAWDAIDTVARVELVGAFRVNGRTQGGTSMFNFGMGYGMILQALASAGIPYKRVTPQIWKRRAGLIGRGKDASRTRAMQLCPGLKLPLKKHHGCADAVLIAYFGGAAYER
jgi:Holliday junction resolvasome RuvABC endonuclease subunit